MNKYRDAEVDPTYLLGSQTPSPAKCVTRHISEGKTGILTFQS